MSKETKPGFVTMDGICPITRELRSFHLSQNFTMELKRNGPEWKFLDAISIPSVISSPSAIFKDLNREEYDDAYCYSGVPPHSHKLTTSGTGTIAVPFPKGFVLLVYVYTNRNGFVIFDWDKRLESPSDPGHPENWRIDFKDKLWSR